MPPIKEHWRLAIGCGELQAAGCRLISRLDLCDNAAKRPAAQTIFSTRQDLDVIATLRVNDLVWGETDLLQPRCIEIKPAHDPKHVHPAGCRKARRCSCREQGRGRIVIER